MACYALTEEDAENIEEHWCGLCVGEGVIGMTQQYYQAPTLTCIAHVTLESDIECVATSTFMRIEDKKDEELHILKKQRITESPTLRLCLTSFTSPL